MLLLITAYWIAFGPHGPRELPPAGQGWWVFKWTVIYVAGSCVVFFIIRMFARPAPKTMNREWQEATNEYLRVRLKRFQRVALYLLNCFSPANNDTILISNKKSSLLRACLRKVTRAKGRSRVGQSETRIKPIFPIEFAFRAWRLSM